MCLNICRPVMIVLLTGDFMLAKSGIVHMDWGQEKSEALPCCCEERCMFCSLRMSHHVAWPSKRVVFAVVCFELARALSCLGACSQS